MSSPFHVTEPFAAKVAALAVTGLGYAKIAEVLTQEMGVTVTWRNVKRAQESSYYKSAMAQLSEGVVAAARTQFRQEAAVLVPLAVKVIKQHLEDGNLNAVPAVMKIVGVETQEKVDNNTQIVVQLPNTGPSEAPTIEVPNAFQNRQRED